MALTISAGNNFHENFDGFFSLFKTLRLARPATQNVVSGPEQALCWHSSWSGPQIIMSATYTH